MELVYFLNKIYVYVVIDSNSCALSIVAGNCLSFVSGSLRTSHPEITIGTPMTSIGSGCQYSARGPKNGASAQNTRAILDAVPTACDRRLVGYRSQVIMYTKSKPEKSTYFITMHVTGDTNSTYMYWPAYMQSSK